MQFKNCKIGQKPKLGRKPKAKACDALKRNQVKENSENKK